LCIIGRGDVAEHVRAKPWLAAFAIIAVVALVAIQATTGVETPWFVYAIIGALGGVPASELFSRGDGKP